MRHVCLDRFVHLLNVTVRIFRVGEVHTHQFDVLSVNQDRGSDGTFVDVFGVDDSLPPPSVQHDSDSVFVVEFSDPMKMCVVCLPYFSLFMSPRFTQENCVPSVAFELACHFFVFFT